MVTRAEAKDIIFSDDSRRAVQRGINQVADAVGVTLGPRGACSHTRPCCEGGAERMSKDYDVEVLGHLPLDIKVREQTDSGTPPVVADPDGRVAEIYRSIARRVAVKIADQQKDRTSKFPNIVIQNT